jgi:hypothetical protein
VHPSVSHFIENTIRPDDVTGKDVLEAGALDVNGSVRPFIEMMSPASYLATDMRAGPGVDRVCLAEHLPPQSADLVICTEMLEHAEDWRAAMLGMTRALRPGGHLVLTTRSPGFPLHGYPSDHWRFPVETMLDIMQACGLDVLRCVPDPEQSGVFAVAVQARTPDLSALAGMHALPARDAVPDPADMKIVCFYATLSPETEQALSTYAPDTEYVDVSADDGAYWRAICERWNTGRDLVIIEQDIEIGPGMLDSFNECPGQWCCFGYHSEPAGPGPLGCTRFRAALQRHVTTKRISPDPYRHWAQIAPRMHDTVVRHGYAEPHMHGDVIHHHDYTAKPPHWLVTSGEMRRASLEYWTARD